MIARHCSGSAKRLSKAIPRPSIIWAIFTVMGGAPREISSRRASGIARRPSEAIREPWKILESLFQGRLNFRRKFQGKSRVWLCSAKQQGKSAVGNEQFGGVCVQSAEGLGFAWRG